MEIDTVELTFNEVEHGMALTPIDLIVVDKILPTKDPVTGEVVGATGGRRRVWVDWTPVSRISRPPSTPTCFRPTRPPECSVEMETFSTRMTVRCRRGDWPGPRKYRRRQQLS
jgi:hypothetical protein